MVRNMRLSLSPTNYLMSLQLLTLKNTGELLMWSCLCGQPHLFPCSKHVADDMTCFEPEAGGYRVEGILFHKFYFNNGKEMRWNTHKRLIMVCLNIQVKQVTFGLIFLMEKPLRTLYPFSETVYTCVALETCLKALLTLQLIYLV